MVDDFELKNRKKIYHLIKKNPGINLTDISKITKLSIQLIDYHASHLEKFNLIEIDRKIGFRRYYPKDKIGAKEKQYLSVLRREIPLKIVLYLIENPYSHHRKILDNFEISASALTYHLNKLIKNEIIVFTKKEGEHGTYSVKDKNEIIKFLISYKPHKILKRFKDTWDEFHIP